MSLSKTVWAVAIVVLVGSVLTVLVRVALPIELGEVRSPYLESPHDTRIIRPRSKRAPQKPVRPVRFR